VDCFPRGGLVVAAGCRT